MLEIQIILIALVAHASAFVGYDCGSKSMNVTTLSLLGVEPCDIPSEEISVKETYFQLLQLNDYYETNVFSCKIEIQRSIARCGMFAHSVNVDGGMAEYIYEVSRQQCEELYITGVIGLYNVVFSGIKVNQTINRYATIAGKLSRSGDCDGTTFSDIYGTWTEVYVQAMIKFTVTSHMARVNLNTNQILLPSGVSCQLHLGSCIDNDEGYTFWNPIPRDSCNFKQYSILYEGIGNKMQDETLDDAEIVYSFASKDVTFAFSKRSEDSVCGYQVIRTEHPQLIIFETKKGRSFAEQGHITTGNMDIFTYINSKFIYVERHIREQIKHLYRDIIVQKCTLERQTIMNSLAIAAQSPDQFAYNLMQGPGYMAVIAGEVIHVIKCIPVEVKLHETEDCYLELPVVHQEEIRYLTPKTRILKTQGTMVTCNKILPPVYQINDGWYKMLPHATETFVPKQIKPLTKPTWKYVSPSNLATSGIYSESDLNQLRDRIMFPIERPALLNNVALEMNGNRLENQQGTLIRLLNEDAVNKIFESTWSKLWSKFMSFGAASAGIIAILALIQGVKMFIDILINGYLLHQIYGWSIHLLGALWNSVATLLIQANQRKENTNAEVHYSRAETVDVEAQNKKDHPQPILPESITSNINSANIEANRNYFNI